MTDVDVPAVYTIGHSNHPLEAFLALLRLHLVEEVVDVRSAPHSRVFPWFCRTALASSLQRVGIAYSFLGGQLGARPSAPSCYRDGKADYELIARSAAFKSGIERVKCLAPRRRLALLCAEKEPLNCHRAILIAPALIEVGVDVRHILADGSLEDHLHTEQRLLALTGIGPTLFGPRDRTSLIKAAYRKRALEISYTQTPSEASTHG